uniref:Uncharacterized protein n=1 Tax=Caenorhabditis japonica TaxID=281687 RepID=A0A8R1HZF2_CAEJA
MDSLAWLARWLAGLDDSWHAVPAGSGSVEMSLAVQMSLVELRATGRIREGGRAAEEELTRALREEAERTREELRVALAELKELRKVEPEEDEEEQAEAPASENSPVRDIRELPRIPRKSEALRETGSFCEVCEEYGHAIDVCVVYPHSEARRRRLHALNRCIVCGLQHVGECQDRGRECHSCGNRNHMYPLCDRRYGEEVIAARKQRAEAAASKSRRKRQRRQAFAGQPAPPRSGQAGSKTEKSGKDAPRRSRRRSTTPKRSSK